MESYMTFKTLSSLLATQLALTEASDELGSASGLVGPKAHPVLSRAELVRFADKLDQARNKLEEVRSIFKEAPGATGPAHKLHHIGAKGGFDMGAFGVVNTKLDELEDAIDELHQAWGMQVQSETGLMDDEDDAEPMDPEADADDLPPPDDEAPVEPTK